MKFPCQDCEERTAGCHGVCEEYAEAQAAKAKERAERQRRYEAEAYARSVILGKKVAKVKEKAKR